MLSFHDVLNTTTSGVHPAAVPGALRRPRIAHEGGSQPLTLGCSGTALERQPLWRLRPTVACGAAPASKNSADDKFARLELAGAVPLGELAASLKGACYGCGAMLQVVSPAGAGYVPQEKYEVKKLHRQLGKVLCARCSGLSNGAMIPGVEDFVQKLQRKGLGTPPAAVSSSPSTASPVPAAAPAAAHGAFPEDAAGRTAVPAPPRGAARLGVIVSEAPVAAAGSLSMEALGAGDDGVPRQGGRLLVTPEELRAQLLVVRGKPAVVVLLVDLLDASGTLMGRVRDIVGSNPVVLVGTKMDLLPKGFRPSAVAEWLGAGASHKHLNVVSTHLVSSHTGEGVPSVTSKICRERKGRDVYVIGAANVGKSAFVRAVLKEMGRFDSPSFDPVALSNGRYLPVESAMPGTTLGMIPLRAFATGGTLFDTPGVHLAHRVQHMLSPEELRMLHPRKRLQVFVPPAPRDLTDDAAAAAPTLPEPSTSYSSTGTIRLGRSGPATPASGAAAAAAQDEGEDAAASGQEAEDAAPGPTASSSAAPEAKRNSPLWDAPLEKWEMPRSREASTSSEANGRPSSSVKKAAPLPACATYLWSDLVRLDLLLVPASTQLAFYGSSVMTVQGLPLLKEGQRAVLDSAAAESTSGSARPLQLLTCAASVEARGGLVAHDLVVKSDGGRGALADIAVSGLPGWVTVWAPAARRDVRVRVWAPRGVDVFQRPPLPLPNPLTSRVSAAADAAGEEGVDDGREGAASQEQLRGMLQGYSDDSDPVYDPSWWEAMVDMVDAAGEEQEDEEEGDDADEVDAPLAGPSGRTVVGRNGRLMRGVSATVGDILRRPRLLDMAAMALDEEEEEDEDWAEKDAATKSAKRGPGSAPPRRRAGAAAVGRPGVARRTAAAGRRVSK